MTRSGATTTFDDILLGYFRLDLIRLDFPIWGRGGGQKIQNAFLTISGNFEQLCFFSFFVDQIFVVPLFILFFGGEGGCTPKIILPN